VEIWGYNGSNKKTALGRSAVSVLAGQAAEANIKMALYREENMLSDISNLLSTGSTLDPAYDHWIEITGNITVSGSSLIVPPEMNITLSGGGNFTIDSSTMSMPLIDFVAGTNTSTLTLRDITLSGITPNVVVKVPGKGTLVLEKGSKIINGGAQGVVLDASSGNTASLKMYPGSEISGNGGTYAYGGGVLVDLGGKFDMYGGTIKDNHANNGGGVSVSQGSGPTPGGIFNMYGGTISHHTVSVQGGGVYVDTNTPNPGELNKSGGIIYGSNADASLRNTAVSGGDAVFDTSNIITSNNTLKWETGRKAWHKQNASRIERRFTG
jgi:hypothetical protein